MASLTISQIQAIKEHMTDDMSMLSKKFKAKKNPYDTQTVLLNELDDYLSKGWEEVSKLKYKAKIQKLKPAGRRFEDGEHTPRYIHGGKTDLSVRTRALFHEKR